jgi:uncharacterized membrane protein YgcG
MGPRTGRRASRAGLLSLVLASTLGSLVVAAGPPFAARPDGDHVLDDARVIPAEAEAVLEETLRTLAENDGVDLVLYTQVKGGPRSRAATLADADALREEWRVGGSRGNGAAMLWNLDAQKRRASSAVSYGQRLGARIDVAAADKAVTDAMKDALEAGDWASAAASGMAALSIAAGGERQPEATPVPSREPERTLRPRPTPGPGETPSPLPSLGPLPPAGPPYPDAIDGVRVYDYARVLDPATVRAVGDTIRAIEERTGAQIVVYTQIKPESDSVAEAEADAAALIDQWGVGRKGFDDGLAILFDLDTTRCHGQVQLRAGSGYAATFLTDRERQRIFEQDMLPSLRACDLDGALLFAMDRIDEAATADHARTLTLSRQLDAATGLVLAPLVLTVLLGWAGWSWLRYGRDPEYLDDPSIHLPAPPPGMTPAVATVVLDGRARSRALNTAMVDLASRGEISLRQPHPAADGKLVIDLTVPDQRDARLARNRREPLGPAESYLLEELRTVAGTKRTLTEADLRDFRGQIEGFEDRLERAATDRGWFREPPERAVERWSFRAGIVLILGLAGLFFGLRLPSNGLLLVGAALIVAAIGMNVLARVMPQRTMDGARVFAQLAAYRRTLQKTLEGAHTVDQVLDSAVLPWVETPDQVLLWSFALGLHEEAEELLERSLEEVRSGAASPTRTYFPIWYSVGERTAGRTSSEARGATAGLFSASALPDFASMTAALSALGRSAHGSGSGGASGGFGGGSSGGGGGAGGGF